MYQNIGLVKRYPKLCLCMKNVPPSRYSGNILEFYMTLIFLCSEMKSYLKRRGCLIANGAISEIVWNTSWYQMEDARLFLPANGIGCPT